MYWAWLPGPLLLVTTGKGTESWTLRSCKRSFLAVSVMICSWSRWFSFCSECRALSISTTAEKRRGEGGQGQGREQGMEEREGDPQKVPQLDHTGGGDWSQITVPLPATPPVAQTRALSPTQLLCLWA